MADSFSFKPTWRELVELFGLLEHAVVTTARHIHSRHRLEQWSDVNKIDLLIDMLIKAGQDWVLATMTRPGAAHLITVTAVGDYLSSHMGHGGESGGLQRERDNFY